MIRIGIVDDEKIILDSICETVDNILMKYNVEYKICKFTDGKSLIREYLKHNFDLILLDIDMPNITGIDVARKLRSHDDTVGIIFVTNKDDLVYESIKYGPFRFIKKSQFDIEISEAIEKYLQKRAKRKESIIFSTENGKKAIIVSNIEYIEVRSHKLTVHTKSGILEANGNLKDIELNVAQYGFIRIHQSYLVNFKFIDVIRQNSVVLDNGNSLPLSRRRYNDVKKALMRFSREL
ncbi:MAG: LytTR family DNA-binding domain-containing protein [Ruminococcus flavefaciens]|nr:LytTR family DNA-binding domain-containing protein [Ruminococcus flavefaciens]